MRTITKLIAVSPKYTVLFRFKNAYNKNLTTCRPFSSKNITEQNTTEGHEIKLFDKDKPFLLVPMNFFDQLFKPQIDHKLIMEAIQKLQKQNNTGDSNIYIAAINPVNDDTSTTSLTHQHIKDYQQDSNSEEQNDSIEVSIVNKLGNQKNMIKLELNNEIRKQFHSLAISELNMEYIIEMPDIKEIIKRYKKNSLMKVEQNHQHSLLPLKFTSEIKGSIKLKKEKLDDILNRINSENFNTILSSLLANICGKAMEKGFEFKNSEKTWSSKKRINKDENKLSSCIKVKSNESINPSKELDYSNVPLTVPTELKNFQKYKTPLKAQNFKKQNSNNIESNNQELISKTQAISFLKQNQLNSLASLAAIVGSCGQSKMTYPCGCPKENSEKSSNNKRSNPCTTAKSICDTNKSSNATSPCSNVSTSKAKSSPCDSTKTKPCEKSKTSICGSKKSTSCKKPKSSLCDTSSSSDVTKVNSSEKLKNSMCSETKVTNEKKPTKACGASKFKTCNVKKSDPCGSLKSKSKSSLCVPKNPNCDVPKKNYFSKSDVCITMFRRSYSTDSDTPESCNISKNPCSHKAVCKYRCKRAGKSNPCANDCETKKSDSKTNTNCGKKVKSNICKTDTCPKGEKSSE